MSVVLCYWSDSFSLIATDTKRSFGGDRMGEKPFFTNDKCQKLHKMRYGWGAGAGCVDLIDDVIIQIDSIQNGTQEDRTEVYLDCLMRHVLLMKYSPDDLNDTGIAISALVVNKADVVPASIIYAYSLHTSPSKKYVPIINKEQICIMYPIEYLRDDTLLKEFLAHYSMEFKGNMIQCVVRICELFDEIQKHSTGSVSRICDIGIVNIEPLGIEKIRIRDDVDRIKNDTDNNFRNASTYESISIFSVQSISGSAEELNSPAAD